ncbi:MAG: glycosyltransferase family 4 protein [Candidatus Binatia bacterium]
MGILVITWNFPPRQGGIERLIFNLCHGLRKRHQLFVITSFAPSVDRKEDWTFRPKWSGLLPFFLYALCHGFFLLRRNPEIKVILGGSALVTPLVLLLGKIFHRKVVVNVHGSDLVYPSTLYQSLCVRWLRLCDRVVANSRYTASLAEEKKVGRGSVCVITPGVDWEPLGPLRVTGVKDVKREMALEGRKVLLYVGRLVRRKGVKEFLQRSLVNIVAEIPEVCFVIVGENATESLIHGDDVLSEIRDLVRELRLENQVRLIGRLSDGDLARFYQAADLMVLPVLSLETDVEGFGMVLLEGAAAGKPAVATRVGGIPDAVEDGKSGIIVEPEDYPAMTKAVVNLLRDDQTRWTVGGYAQRRAREQFGWDLIIRKYEEIFESLANGKCG